MIDNGPFTAHRHPDPGDEASREARHGVLIELLGAYADGELPAETSSQIDAHLLGCARCRSELSIHESIRGRLAVEPPSGGSPALRARIAAAIAAAPEPAPVSIPERRLAPRARIAIAVAVVLAAAATALGARAYASRESAATVETRALAADARSVPLLDVVLEDYARVTAGDLPGRARDLAAVRGGVPFPVEPMRGPGLRLLAAWTTDLRGEPAAALAYRLGDGLVLQYLVSEQLFFRHPAVRAAVSERHVLSATDGARALVAWPEAEAGSVLVADMPLERLAALPAAEAQR